MSSSVRRRTKMVRIVLPAEIQQNGTPARRRESPLRLSSSPQPSSNYSVERSIYKPKQQRKLGAVSSSLRLNRTASKAGTAPSTKSPVAKRLDFWTLDIIPSTPQVGPITKKRTHSPALPFAKSQVRPPSRDEIQNSPNKRALENIRAKQSNLGLLLYRKRRFDNDDLAAQIAETRLRIKYHRNRANRETKFAAGLHTLRGEILALNRKGTHLHSLATEEKKLLRLLKRKADHENQLREHDKRIQRARNALAKANAEYLKVQTSQSRPMHRLYKHTPARYR